MELSAPPSTEESSIRKSIPAALIPLMGQLDRESGVSISEAVLVSAVHYRQYDRLAIFVTTLAVAISVWNAFPVIAVWFPRIDAMAATSTWQAFGSVMGIAWLTYALSGFLGVRRASLGIVRSHTIDASLKAQESDR